MQARRPGAGAPPLAALALISGAALGYEVLLTRLMSIVQWHHFAHMIISLALLGYGVSGTFLAFTARRLEGRFRGAFAVNAALFGVSGIGCFLLAQALPFNPLELFWDPVQPLWLALVYLVLFPPFFFAANCIGLSFYSFPDRIPAIYAYDLVGAGAGSLLVLGLLYLLAPDKALMATGALGLAAALVAWLPGRAAASWATALVLLAAALWAPDPVSVQPSPYKGLSQALRTQGAHLLEQRSSPLGLLSVVASPRIPLRHAPGLSLASASGPPEQLGVFTDAGAMSVITRVRSHPGELDFLGAMTSALPYALSSRPRVLVLGAGGGLDVLQALHHGASRVDAVELNPQMVDLVRAHGEYAGRLYTREPVRVRIAEARGYAAGADHTYDVVQLALVDSFAAASAGLYALNESYLYTREALQIYLQRLEPGGVLAFTRWLKLPPRDGLKLFATAIEALKALGVSAPARHLAWIRGWSTSTLLVARQPLGEEQIGAIREFCAELGFDLIHLPGMRAAEANQHNVLLEPVFHAGAAALLGPDRAAYMQRYKFDIRPATDDRPYFFNFFRWSSLPEILRLREQGAVALLDAGYLILILTLGQAILAGLALVLLPAWLTRPERRGTLRPWVMGYFMLVGLAFLFIEIAFIQKLILFLAHPVFAVALVLSAFLVFAGLGSGYAQRLARRRPLGLGTAVRNAVLLIAVLATAYLLAIPWLVQAASSLAPWVRAVLALALIAPLALLMGLPFPLGLSAVGRRARELIPLAWAVNGFASVMAAALASLLALHAGFNAVVLAAVLCYGGAAGIMVWRLAGAQAR